MSVVTSSTYRRPFWGTRFRNSEK